MIPRHMMRRFGYAVELGKKLHENLTKMTCKSKITTGKRGSILPSLKERIEQAMRYATTSVETKRGNTYDPASRREPNPRLSTPSQPSDSAYKSGFYTGDRRHRTGKNDLYWRARCC